MTRLATIPIFSVHTLISKQDHLKNSLLTRGMPRSIWGTEAVFVEISSGVPNLDLGARCFLSLVQVYLPNGKKA